MGDVPLWMLIGLPGSGKSTWATQFKMGRSPLLYISTDHIRAQLYGQEAIQGEWRLIWQQVQAQLHLGVAKTRQGDLGGALYDATNTRRRARRDVIQAARLAGFNRVLAIWLDVPLACCLQRNRQRSRQVPVEVIGKMARQLAGAPPQCDEGFDGVFQVGL